LRQAGLPQLVQLGETLHAWSAEIATMWRFTRNNGITEGFHTKMEVLQPCWTRRLWAATKSSTVYVL
jgi:hypothetical protein